MGTRDQARREAALRAPLAAALLLIMLLRSQALADGKAFYRSRDFAAFVPIEQREQRAAIVHRDGIQRMVIAINLDLWDDENAV